MADDPIQDVDQLAGKDAPAKQEETNWGEDWESAFQAEDNAFFSDGKEEEFFLEENEPTATTVVADQNLAPALEKPPSGTPAHGVASGTPQAKARAGLEALTSFFLSGKTAAQKQIARLQSFPIIVRLQSLPLFAHLQSLPIFVRIPVYALPLLLVSTLFILILSNAPESPTGQHPNIATVSPDKATGQDGQGKDGQLDLGKGRKKLAFPSFIVPVNNPASDQPVIFVLVNISLIASLEDQEDLPPEKKVFVRDIIYQFFQNKPLEELRRFSLARGEMNRELRAWIKKQWPEAPIESITFHQYHLS